MGKLTTTLMQKILPATKKKILIKMRKPNGAWDEFLLKPTTKSFKRKNDSNVYILEGHIPDIDDCTGQRVYTFLQGVITPIKFNIEQPAMIELSKQQGNTQLLLTEGKHVAFQEAMLLKGKKGMDIMLIVLILVIILVFANMGISYMSLEKLGGVPKFM